VENLIAAREREIAGARLAAARLQQRLRSTPDRGTAADMVEVILGREAVTQRFRALSTGAKDHVEILVKPPYVTPMAENREEEDRLAHGVRYRLIYEGPMLEDPGQLEVIRLLVGAGARVRILPSLPTKLAIFDGRFAFLAYAPHLADDPGVGALLVRPSPLLDALSTLFEILWDRAVPFGKAAELPTKRNLTPDDQTLLALLAAGLKDEAIARHLQLGHRTIQRRVARLMSILGVDTRFQAGMQARDRGWLALDPPGS
jgi:DNA-binding CsgD family transcriptional regulator